MAELLVLGDWEGPGEQRTAEHLEASLPSSWVIIAGRKLPGKDRDDVDLLVIGDHLIFLLEEKAWGPTIVVGDNRWQVKGQYRPNPLDRANHLARVVAGWLRDKVPHWPEAAKQQKRVVAGVVLSHPALQLLAAREHNHEELILPLSVVVEELLRLDKAAAPGFAPARPGALSVLRGLGQRDPRVRSVGVYEIEQELAPVGRARCFRARQDGQEVLLRCYPVYGWEGDDPEIFIRREEHAIRTLATQGRAWQSHPVFRDDDHQWLVVPVVPPPDTRNLAVSMTDSDPARPLPADLARRIVQDAFQALAEVHEQQIVHRALHPQRIWLGRQMRVCFSDFYYARITGEHSIALFVDDNDLGRPYRAPECAASLVFATPSSDVYSLALSVAGWLIGDLQGEPDRVAITQRLQEHGELGQTLVACLNGEAKRRPSAAAVAEQLRPTEVQPPQPATNVFGVDQTIQDRYQIKRKLGRGSYATTWQAWDVDRQQSMVLKEFHSAQTAAHAEYAVADVVRHGNCAKVYDVQLKTPPGFLVLEYIDGDNLRDRARHAPIDLPLARRIARRILDALSHIHSLNRVHADVSPGNIIVNTDDEAFLIDFGLAAVVGQQGSVGTPAVMAPEVLDGAYVSVQSDLYSFAASLAMAMLGRAPYKGNVTDGPMRDSTPAPPTQSEREQWGPEGAAFLDALFRAFDPDPANRPADAIELDRLLEIAQPNTPPPGKDQINPTVDDLRSLYRGSSSGNNGNRGMDDAFAEETYVETRLDQELMPAILNGDLQTVFLTGNPGDGKTSFLAKVRTELRQRGGEETRFDHAGWQIDFAGRAYFAVYDASESHEGSSSDELLQAALGSPDETGRRVTLIAANDGRLLQFFKDFEHRYQRIAMEVRRQIHEGAPATPEVTVVDLKQRALADLDRQGLAAAIVDTFVADRRWEVCASCTSREVCPIRKNAAALQANARESVVELILISHLRRRRRATFRDVRSAIAWLITGDLTCGEVHRARSAELDLSRDPSRLLANLAFDRQCGDYLVQEWTDMDPALVAAPDIERAARMDRSLVPDPAIFDYRAAAAAFRGLYMGTWFSNGPATRDRVRAYRYLPTFIDMLRDPAGRPHLERLLLGASRLVGAPLFANDGLAIREGDLSSGWAVLKAIPANQFSLRSNGRGRGYVESIPDRLTLQHEAGPSTPLTLDSVELLLRAADGEILNDVHSDSVRQELDGFAAQLRRQSATVVQIIDPAGSTAVAVRRGQRIHMDVS
ncbi:protein kinase domain-containing protein [Dactylosporangium matsuzakiense]|uniref:protein kinase domain-containing protein n=1 Tax=Dactylosporangium matsuzakiense TaxID=53360 RepID=UPI0021C3AEAA|nr:protein kinase [Dactylosporangium matsuzakiense]UWZ45321.1 protein kinase [Dactylosporangium matsuzakiense]